MVNLNQVQSHHSCLELFVGRVVRKPSAFTAYELNVRFLFFPIDRNGSRARIRRMRKLPFGVPMAGLADHCELALRQVSEFSHRLNGCDRAGANFRSWPGV